MPASSAVPSTRGAAIAFAPAERQRNAHAPEAGLEHRAARRFLVAERGAVAGSAFNAIPGGSAACWDRLLATRRSPMRPANTCCSSSSANPSMIPSLTHLLTARVPGSSSRERKSFRYPRHRRNLSRWRSARKARRSMLRAAPSRHGLKPTRSQVGSSSLTGDLFVKRRKSCQLLSREEGRFLRKASASRTGGPHIHNTSPAKLRRHGQNLSSTRAGVDVTTSREPGLEKSRADRDTRRKLSAGAGIRQHRCDEACASPTPATVTCGARRDHS